MTDDLKERLRNPMGPEVDGYRHTYPWVIDLCEEAFNHITDLEARLAVAEAEAKRWEESSNKMTEFYEHRGKLLEGVNAKLAAVEAREGALAEALAFYGDPSGWNQPPVKVLEGLFTTEYENQASRIRSDRGKVARAALAAYEARRKG